MANVTMIPATKNKFTVLPMTILQKRRTAGYARVSTDSEEQFTSYEVILSRIVDTFSTRE